MKKTIVCVFLSLSVIFAAATQTNLSQFTAANAANRFSATNSSGTESRTNSFSTANSTNPFAGTATESTSSNDQQQSESIGIIENSALRTQYALAEPDYCVTPGDIYQLAYAVSSNIISTTLVVDTSYKVRIHNLGILDTRGKTFQELKLQVENLVSKNYPLSGVQFVLQSPGVFKVRAKGQVVKAGEFKADGLTRLHTFYTRLDKTAKASDREVKIISANGRERTYDLFKFYRDADLTQNPYLKQGDTVVIPTSQRKIAVSGEILRPGIYILKDGENLRDAIEFYGGGFTINSDKERISITRITPDAKNSTGSFYQLTAAEIDTSPLAELHDYDTITVGNRQLFLSTAFFEGALNLSEETNERTFDTGETMRVPYRFQPGTMVSTAVLANSNLFKVTADLKTAYIQRDTEMIPVNCWKFLYEKDFTGDFALENGDIIIIPQKQLFVLVSGAVVNPGQYAYIPDRDINYYINIAGGIKETNSNGRNIQVMDFYNNIITNTDAILPETKIYVPYNSFSYNFSRYAPTVTTVLSILGTTISIMATMGAFN